MIDQQKIIDALKGASFMGIEAGHDHTTTLTHIRGLFPDTKEEDIGNVLNGMEGVERTGPNMEDHITIPAKYFK